jgi:hypothetical protein
MLEAAEHIKMASAQQTLYQEKVDYAKRTVDNPHSARTYTFVADYGQNMELPCFNKEHPGATYTTMGPLEVNNLGIVDHDAHKDSEDTVGAHIHCHVYTDAVGKKGAINVAYLIVNCEDI